MLKVLKINDLQNLKATMLEMEEGSKRSSTNILLWHEEDKGHFSAFSKLTCLIQDCLFSKVYKVS